MVQMLIFPLCLQSADKRMQEGLPSVMGELDAPPLLAGLEAETLRLSRHPRRPSFPLAVLPASSRRTRLHNGPLPPLPVRPSLSAEAQHLKLIASLLQQGHDALPSSQAARGSRVLRPQSGEISV